MIPLCPTPSSGSGEKPENNVLMFLRLFLERNLGSLTCAFVRNRKNDCICLGRPAYTLVMETTHQGASKMKTENKIDFTRPTSTTHIDTEQADLVMVFEKTKKLVVQVGENVFDGKTITYSIALTPEIIEQIKNL